MENTNRIFSAVVFGVIGLSLAFFRHEQGPPPNDGWFQKSVLESSHPVVVKFGAEWCGPCRGMDEAIGILRPKLSSKVSFYIVDIDKKPELFQHYKSGGGIPQVMIFEHGKVVASQRGFGSTEQLEAWIKNSI